MTTPDPMLSRNWRGLVLASLAAILATACHPPRHKAVRGEDLTAPKASVELSVWIRSNPGHFWAFMAGDGAREVKPYLGHEGIIIGDAHVGNFSVMPVTLTSGKTAMRYLDIDFDDAGRGPFVGDLVRLVATTKAINKDIKVNELVTAYMQGLRGDAMTPPQEVARLLAITETEYDDLRVADIKDRTGKKGFKLKAGEVESYEGDIALWQIGEHIPDTNVIEVVRRPSESGSNAGGLRLWVLTEDLNLERRFYELKQWRPSSLVSYHKQPDVATWVKEVRAAFWPGVSEKGYELIDLADHGRFWLREKKVTLIDVPYSSTNQGKVEYLRQLAVYDAYVLGTLHGRQAGAAGLRASLANLDQRETFKDAVKNVAYRYLGSVAPR